MSTQEEQTRPTGVGIGWRAYQQIAAIIGSFALLAFLGNFVDFDWRGLISTLIGVWDEYVRPPVQTALHYLIEVPLDWVGWHVELAQWFRDYLAAGFVLAASVFRAYSDSVGWRQTLADLLVPHWDFSIVGWLPIVVLGWPFTFVLVFMIFLSELKEKDYREAWVDLLVMSPLAYAGVLVALNSLVLH